MTQAMAAPSAPKQGSMMELYRAGLSQAMYLSSVGDVRYTHAPLQQQVPDTCESQQFIIRNILLKNINSQADVCYQNAKDDLDDNILRPVALLDIAYRDLQECKDWPLSYTEKRRYHRTMEYMHNIWKRLYRHMGEGQIYQLTEAMEKMENNIQKDYQILQIQILEGLRSVFYDDDNRTYVAKLCVLQALVDIPRKYMESNMKAKIEDLERVSANVIAMKRYFSERDKCKSIVNLNNIQMISLAAKAFANRFKKIKMVEN